MLHVSPASFREVNEKFRYSQQMLCTSEDQWYLHQECFTPCGLHEMVKISEEIQANNHWRHSKEVMKDLH